MFTRFGSKLEAGIEARIRRGRILRALLKQDRLFPMEIERQMAWLVAYNEGWIDLENMGDRMERISGMQLLPLSESREAWVSAVRKALE